MLDSKTLKFKKLIEDAINEHNRIWKDISWNMKFYYAPKEYNCFNLEEDKITSIASYLARKYIED